MVCQTKVICYKDLRLSILPNILPRPTIDWLILFTSVSEKDLKAFAIEGAMKTLN
jgi:hypothetical protein